MSRQLSEAYAEHEHTMRNMLEDTTAAQKEYLDLGMTASSRITRRSRRNSRQITSILQIISRKQSLLLRNSGLHVTRPCRNMSRLQRREWIVSRHPVSVMLELAQANRQVVAEFDARLQEFMNYQKLSYKTMDQVRRLLADISATGSGKNVSLTSGQMAQKQSFDKLEELLEQQGEQQQALLEELNRNLRELTKGAQKGKFGIFR